jgi:hypothetical protein
MELLVGMTGALKRSLGLDGLLQVMLGVPANANSNQRFLTAEAFQRAGFQVLAEVGRAVIPEAIPVPRSCATREPREAPG